MEQNHWAFYPIGADDNYAGIITALSIESEESELSTVYANFTFNRHDDGKVVLIDKKLPSEKNGPDYGAHRFMDITIYDGEMVFETMSYTYVRPEMKEKANALLQKYRGLGMIEGDKL